MEALNITASQSSIITGAFSTSIAYELIHKVSKKYGVPMTVFGMLFHLLVIVYGFFQMKDKDRTKVLKKLRKVEKEIITEAMDDSSLSTTPTNTADSNPSIEIPPFTHIA
jgi:hypothetical protein